jgi:hypothetical protein
MVTPKKASIPLLKSSTTFVFLLVAKLFVKYKLYSTSFTFSLQKNPSPAAQA